MGELNRAPAGASEAQKTYLTAAPWRQSSGKQRRNRGTRGLRPENGKGYQTTNVKGEVPLRRRREPHRLKTLEGKQPESACLLGLRPMHRRKRTA